jgi:tetratricopeptide (TPR) repeat protein
VGRETELGELRRALDEAVGARECRLVTLVGEAGVGKSRLAHELLAVVAEEASVLRGRCLPYGEGITFWPIAEILEQAAGISSDASPDEARSKLSASLADEDQALAKNLAAVLGLGDAAGALQETFLSVRRFLEHHAADRPLVVVFDDIQWGEGTFLDLVQYLATFVRSRPLLLLCLARPELLDSRPDWSQVGPMMRLHPLDPGASVAMVSNLLGGGAEASDIATTIVGSTSGNPLFIEETLRMLVDRGLLERRGDRWQVTCDMSELAAPDTVHAVIAARLDSLEPNDRALLQSASVVGEVFWWGAVADLARETTSIDVGRSLQALVRKELIRPDPMAFFGEDAFRFGHLLIRDVAYDSLPKRARASLHERFAEWVADRAGARATEYDEIVGYHLERAYRYITELAPPDERSTRMAATAANKLSEAGKRSFERGDMTAAASLLSRAVDLFDTHDSERPQTLFVLGEALWEIGRLAESEPTFAEAVAAAERLGDRALEWRARVAAQELRMHFHIDAGHEEGLELAGRALEVFRQLDDDIGQADALRSIGRINFWAGRCEFAIGVFREGLAHAQRAGDRPVSLELMRMMCLALTQGPTPASEAIEQIHSLADANADDRLFFFKTRRYLAILEAMRGNFSESRALVATGDEMGRELGADRDFAAGHLRDSGVAARLQGDIEGAEERLRRACEMLREMGDLGHMSSVAGELALVILEEPGREQEALELAEEAARATLADDADAMVLWLSAKARALAALGRTAEAEGLARDAVERAWVTDYFWLQTKSAEALAEVLRLAGRTGEAAEALTKAIAVHHKKGNVVLAEADRRWLAELEGAAGVGRSSDA